MYFDVSTLTNEGKALLTRATAGTKIIWGKCGCFTQETPGASSTSLIGKVASGTAVAVFEATDNTAKVTCSVDNATDGLTEGYANSFGLWAKLEGDTDETLVLVAYVTDTPATYFPECTSVSTKVGAIIDLSVTVADGVIQTINIIESGYALAANLQAEIDEREALAGRVVTTHSSTSESVGDEQTILGQKNFRDELTAEEIRCTHLNVDKLQAKDVETNWFLSFDTDLVDNCVKIQPGSGDWSLGTQSVPFKQCHVSTLSVDYIDKGGGLLTLEYISDSDEVNVSATYGKWNLGTTSKPWSKLVSGTIQAGTVLDAAYRIINYGRTALYNDVLCNTNLNVTKKATIGGDCEVKGLLTVEELTIRSIDDELLGGFANAQSLPTPGIGQIALLAVTNQISLSCGTQFQSTGSNIYIAEICRNTDGSYIVRRTGSALETGGEWRALCAASGPNTTSGSPNGDRIVLAIRVA